MLFLLIIYKLKQTLGIITVFVSGINKRVKSFKFCWNKVKYNASFSRVMTTSKRCVISKFYKKRDRILQKSTNN